MRLGEQRFVTDEVASHKRDWLTFWAANMLFSLSFFVAIYQHPLLEQLSHVGFYRFLLGGVIGALLLFLGGWIKITDSAATLLGVIFQIAGTLSK